MITAGVIPNPSAGRDIRRLVARGRVVSNQEKANTLRRIFSGLAALGVQKILVMPDSARLSEPGRSDCTDSLDFEYLDMVPVEHQDDSTRAARMMVERGVSCIVTLGGDGTNRVVAKGCGDVPLVPVSTGTNNVFPQMVEGTLAGMAAGAVATGAVPCDAVCTRSKRLDILVDGEPDDIALVDAAVTALTFTGARAIWDIGSLHEVFLTRAEPASIGLSSIGARLRPTAPAERVGLHLRFHGDEKIWTVVQAPVAPGMVRSVDIAGWHVMEPGEHYPVALQRGTIALDGEREVELLPGKRVEVVLNPDGPRVVDITRANELLALSSANNAQISRRTT